MRLNFNFSFFFNSKIFLTISKFIFFEIILFFSHLSISVKPILLIIKLGDIEHISFLTSA